MGTVIALTRRPGMILPFLRIYADTGLSLLVWYLDMLAAFLVTFAVAYGAFALVEKLFPKPLGARPRVWRVPAVFGAAGAAFCLGMDSVVSDVLRNALDSLSLIPGLLAMRFAGGAWLAGAIIHLRRTAFGTGGFFRTARAAARLPLCEDAAVLDVLRRALADAGIGTTGMLRNPALRTAPAGTPIFSCGLWRACVVVPEDFAARYAPEEQHAILLHECVHVRRRDSLTLACMAFVGAVLWFDPFVRRALRRMKGDIEQFCDWTAVRAHGVAPALYAGLIVHAAAGAAAGNKRFAAAFSEEYRAVAQRLGHVLRDGSFLAPSRLSRRRAGLALAALGAAAAAATVYYAGLPPTPPTPEGVVRGALGEAVEYEERHGVFSVYAFAYTSREKN